MNDNEAIQTRMFIDGAPRFHDLLYLLTKDKTLLKNDVSHTSVIALDEDEWANVKNVEWNSTAIAVAKKPKEKLVLVGEDGQVCTYVGGVSDEEQITPAPRMIRRAKTIDGYVYACGMMRQVFQRTGENKWVDISALTPSLHERVGFEAIDGYTENEIYAVGWGGEIWHFNGTIWSNKSGITNLILTSICCAEDGLVYIVGQQGVFIRGRNNKWEIIDLDFNSDFWDIRWFQGKLFLSTMTGIYTFENNQLNLVDVDDILNTSFYRLTASEGVLWSIGSYNIVSFDGKKWTRYI